jgi:hypothetical protein
MQPWPDNCEGPEYRPKTVTMFEAIILANWDKQEISSLCWLAQLMDDFSDKRR